LTADEEEHMQHRPLGRSGVAVSSLALGTMIFGEDSPRSTSPDEAARIIDRYLEAGGTHIDTADVYAGGRSEEIVGSALGSRRDGVVLATKVRFATGGGPNDVGLSRRHVVGGVEASLRRLGTDWIDLLYMHAWDPATPIEETLAAFDDLVGEGKVHYIGISNVSAWQAMKTLGVADAAGFSRPVAGQYQYNLLTRSLEWEFEPLFEAEGVGLVPWSPLGGGFLSGKYRPGDRPTAGRIATQSDRDEEAWHRKNTDRNWAVLGAVTEVADEMGATPSQVALAWLLTRPVVSSVIIGVRTMDQLEDNLGAAGLVLPSDAVARLDSAGTVEPPYPYRFQQVYGGRTIE
jgi:aryl-alcohol dehydrogenase-like predicted oxidoreductase